MLASESETLPCASCPALRVQPYEFVVGQPVSAQAVRTALESTGGLFAGASGPKPPQALSKAVIGMKKGGKVRLRSGLLATSCALVASADSTYRAGLLSTMHLTCCLLLPVLLQRSVLVDKADLGFPKGELEIPEGASFELKVEVLEVLSKA